MLSDLFTSKSINEFKCEAFVLPKRHWLTYPVHLNKINVLFDLIHSDVCGPSHVSTLPGYDCMQQLLITVYVRPSST